jgi:hypothetical protein
MGRAKGIMIDDIGSGRSEGMDCLEESVNHQQAARSGGRGDTSSLSAFSTFPY